jgi:hypothetical protein
VGKAQLPSSDELKFIYGLFSRGASESDVLKEYEKLNKYGNLNFPLRQDVRFVRQKRKEFEAAEAILRAKILTEVDPRYKKHWDELASVAAKLSSNLSKIRSHGEKYEKIPTTRFVLDGVVLVKNGLGADATIPERKNPRILEQINGYLAQCLLTHVKITAKLTDDVKTWEQLPFAEITEQLIEKLTFVANGGSIAKSSCQICESWYA